MFHRNQTRLSLSRILFVLSRIFSVWSQEIWWRFLSLNKLRSIIGVKMNDHVSNWYRPLNRSSNHSVTKTDVTSPRKFVVFVYHCHALVFNATSVFSYSLGPTILVSLLSSDPSKFWDWDPANPQPIASPISLSPIFTIETSSTFLPASTLSLSPFLACHTLVRLLETA